MSEQSAKQFLMIKPAAFAFNPETSRTNHYQRKTERSKEEVLHDALREFDDLYRLYCDYDIDVKIYENHDASAPDAIFPNSFSTFSAEMLGKEQGRYTILHPMLDDSRKRERSDELISYFTDDLGYQIAHDLSGHEANGAALEGTGSVVMDHVNKVAYCAISDRSDPGLAEKYAGLIGYEPVIFRTADHNGQPVYHTDVLMYVGSGYVGLCTACIYDEDRARVIETASRYHDLVNISMGQLRSFCGNAVQVQNRSGDLFLAMSSQSFHAMKGAQKSIIENHGVKIIHCDVSTVESSGGGSVRCMTQELF